MKLIKILTAFIALASLQIAAAQWLNMPPPAEARNLMVIGGGIVSSDNCSGDTAIVIDNRSIDHSDLTSMNTNAPDPGYGFTVGPFTFPCTGKLKTVHAYSGNAGSGTGDCAVFKDANKGGTMDTGDTLIGTSGTITENAGSAAWAVASFAGAQSVTKGDYYFVRCESQDGSFDLSRTGGTKDVNYGYGPGPNTTDANTGNTAWTATTATISMLMYITIQAP